MVGNKCIILNNQLLTQNEKMHEYVKKAGISFKYFEISSSGYLEEYSCKNEVLVYNIDSPLAYERNGIGHTYTRGDWKLEETNPVNYIHIYKKEAE